MLQQNPRALFDTYLMHSQGELDSSKGWICVIPFSGTWLEKPKHFREMMSDQHLPKPSETLTQTILLGYLIIISKIICSQETFGLVVSQ